MPKTRIAFHRPTVIGSELSYLQECLSNRNFSGDGPFTKKCQAFFESTLGVSKALLTTSCTHALELCALLLNIQPGDEVITTSFTFVSTINAFVLRGATPVFVDIRPDTLNLDETLLRAAITERTRAIVPVHYAGVGCEMDTIMEIAKERGIAVVEDNAHGLFGKYKGRFLGTMGSLATQSFHQTKNFSCGEGGALLINDLEFIERAEILREKGTNRSRFFRGQVDKYTWVDVGSSFLPSDILAAFLLAQLEKWEEVQQERKELWEFYHSELATWAQDSDVHLPKIPKECEPSYHLFQLVLPDLESRQDFMAYLKKQGVDTVFHYVPLHSSEMGMRLTKGESKCPVTEKISEGLVRLPLYNGLTKEEQVRVVKAVRGFRVHSENSKKLFSLRPAIEY